MSLEIIPLFVKSGSIIPMGTKRVMSVEEIDTSELDIIVYTGADAEFVLYEDAGDGYAYENGIINMSVLYSPLVCQKQRPLHL